MQRGFVERRAQQDAVQLDVVLHVVFGLALLHLVERRLRDVDVAALDQFGDLPIEECKQKRAYVAAVDIRICHYYDAVIAQFGEIEFVLSNSAA